MFVGWGTNVTQRAIGGFQLNKYHVKWLLLCGDYAAAQMPHSIGWIISAPAPELFYVTPPLR